MKAFLPGLTRAYYNVWIIPYFQCLSVNVCILYSPLDTVIVQVQQWGVVGAQQVAEQVLLNGVSLKDKSQEVDSIIQTMSIDALLPTLINVNQTSILSKKIIMYNFGQGWSVKYLSTAFFFLFR